MMLAEEHPITAQTELDRPVWAALSSRQSDLGFAYGTARRYRPDIAPFAATDPRAGDTTHDLNNLLAGTEDGVVLMQADPVATYPGLRQESAETGVQLVPAKPLDLTESSGIVPLMRPDVPAILDLIKQTEPGPFKSHTLLMGRYVGIKHQGRLVAMAGERMKLPDYTEISAVCVHPDCRGQGYARSLVSHVAKTIMATGDTPFLHTYAVNSPAISLYESMGFEVRRRMHIVRLVPDL